MVCVVAALGLVTGGVSAALEGERELHPHETTGALADDGECDTPDETEADEHASQTVAAKANLTAELTLRDDGTLVAQNLGVTGDQDAVVVTRSNPTNVLFINESGEDRRLVLDLGTRPEIDEDGRHRSPTPRSRTSSARTLVEEGGSQFLTFSITTPSARRRRRRTGSSCPASTAPRSRCSYHERPVAPARGDVGRLAYPPLVAASPSPVSCALPAAPTTPRRTPGSRPVRTPRRSRTCSGRCSSSPASSA